MASYSTRSSTEHSILGQPAAFHRNQLPTAADVFRAYDYYWKNDTCNSLHERATLVAHEIKEIYDRSSIPTIEISNIVIRMKRLATKIHDLGKYSDDEKSPAKYQESMQSLDNLFDICPYKFYRKD